VADAFNVLLFKDKQLIYSYSVKTERAIKNAPRMHQECTIQRNRQHGAQETERR
jgi:hypothetical protein